MYSDPVHIKEDQDIIGKGVFIAKEDGMITLKLTL